jgi:NADH-quinone oxidoreductase subunit L
MFHLMTHAFFKALLFLAAGSIIHSLAGEQDIRYMGGLQKKIPLTFLVFLTGALALSGIPPFSGFFSKDEILAAAYSQNPGLWALGVLISVMTAFYTFRLFWLVFKGEYRGIKLKAASIHESPNVMMVPLIILGFLAALGAIPLVLNYPGINSLASFLNPVFSTSETIIHASSNLPDQTNIIIIFVTLALILLSIYFSWSLFIRRNHLPPSETAARKGFSKLAWNKFYIDEFYNSIFVKPLRRLSGFLQDTVEVKILDRVVESTGKLVMFAGSRIRLLQTGNVGFYLFAMVIAIIIVLVFNLIK